MHAEDMDSNDYDNLLPVVYRQSSENTKASSKRLTWGDEMDLMVPDEYDSFPSSHESLPVRFPVNYSYRSDSSDDLSSRKSFPATPKQFTTVAQVSNPVCHMATTPVYSKKVEIRDSMSEQPETTLSELEYVKQFNTGIVNYAFDKERQLLPGNSKQKTNSPKLPITSVQIEGVRSIIKLLKEIKFRIKHCSQSELTLLNRLLNSSKVQRAIITEHKVREYLRGGTPEPVSNISANSATLLCQVINADYSMAMSDDAKESHGNNNKKLPDRENNLEDSKLELKSILERPEIKAVLETHDKIASGYNDDSPSVTQEKITSAEEVIPIVEMANIDGQEVKIVTLNKTEDPLGATVKNEGESVIIARIVKGGVADKSKLLKAGDELIRINDIELKGKSIDEVAEVMASTTGCVKFVVKPNTLMLGAGPQVPKKQITLRAQFDYDPDEDYFIPCQELGISFKIGDILHVINRDDQYWWQAYREGDDFDKTLAGLIPSRLFWETIQQIRKTILADTDLGQSTGCCMAARMRNKKKPDRAGPSDVQDVLTYEEVDCLTPETYKRRPVVLIGCDELKPSQMCERIVRADPQKFSLPIKTISRPLGSANGAVKGCHCLEQNEFIEKIKFGEIIDYRLQDNSGFYHSGICKKDILEVIDSGKVCVLTCQAKNLTKLRTKELQPYIIYMAAPHLERLKSMLAEDSGITPSVDECKHIIDLSRHSESVYSHLFDNVITMTSWEQSIAEVLKVISQSITEKQWVPIDWLLSVTNGRNGVSKHTLTNNSSDIITPNSTPTTVRTRSAIQTERDRSFTPSPRLKRLANKQSAVVERHRNLTPTSVRKMLAKASPLLMPKKSESMSRLADDDADHNKDELSEEEDCV